MSDIVPKKDVPESVHSSYDEDLDLIRSTLRTLLLTGEEGLRMAQDLAEESEHPRAIEVLTGMIKQQADNAHALLASCLLYTSPSPRDGLLSRMPSSA